MVATTTEFDQFADEYDFWMQTVQQSSDYQQILDLLPRPECNVLEVGCGAGRLALFLADACQQVTGVDSSATMIARAEQARRGQGKENVTFVLADIESWPLPEAAYDFIVSTYTLHHTDMALTLPRLRRALRPGGRLFVRDLVCNDGERWRNSNGYHRQRAFKELSPLVRQHGVQAAWRIMKFRLNPAWIHHLRADQVFSAPIIERIYNDHTPGAIFWDNQEEYSVLWNAPAGETVGPPAPPLVGDQMAGPNPTVVRALPWRQQSWEPEHFAKTDVESSLVHVFERQVAQSHHTIAIRMGERSLTYAQLNAEANRIAQTLLEQRGEQAEPIAILLADPVDTIIALLGVLKAGKIYLVLNPDQPAPTLSRICADAGAPLVVTDTAQLATLQSWAGALSWLNLDALHETTATANPALRLTADHLAGIYYTSGSTGEPKGIVRNHRQLLHSTWHNTNAYQITAQDRHSLLYSPSFTAAVPDIFDPLLNGAMLCPFDPKRNSTDELIGWLIGEEITLLHPPVPLFRRLLDVLPSVQSPFPSLRLLILAGQSIYKPDIERFRRHFAPTCQLLFRLAMTEAGSVTHLVIDHTSPIGENISVGYPTADKEILLLDSAGDVVKPGEVGQIAIRSQYLSSGYWQNPTLTTSKFLRDPQNPMQRIYLTGDQGRWRTDGALEYLGRQDTMVKVRGYRVELGAIEAALRAIEQIKECIVIARDDPAGNKQLIAYLVPRTPGLTISKVRQLLMRTLPEYMLPAHFVLLDALPQSLNGKVDAKALPPPGNARPNLDTPFVAPQSELECALARIWANLLGVEAIGIHDNFFELGGHSILALRLLHAVEQHFQQPVALRQFIFKPTIAYLATLFTTNVSSKPPDGDEHAALSTMMANAELHTLYDALDDKAEIDRLRGQIRIKPRLPRPLQHLLRLPQPVALSLFYQLLQQTWVQRRYFASQTAVVQQFLAGMEETPAQKSLITRCLFFGTLSHFGVRHTVFARLQAANKISVEGLDALTAARSRQQGVILLTSHNYQSPYFRTFHLTQGWIGNMTLLTHNRAFDKVRAEHILYARQLELASQTLQQGQAIYITPDVDRGHGTSITVPFHGRMHPFRTSFAELALLTDAQIFFVASDLQAYDRFSFHLLGPFDMGDAAMPHEERVQHLLEQYVAHLRQQWAKNPWALPWWLMSEHLAYPPVALLQKM